ncbi:MAG TPA: energy transducer TonB [Candidatus Obscuribacterales bacterium]
MVASAEVVRICDRFVYGPRDSGLDQNNLPRIAVLLLIAYGALAIAFIHFASLERKQPHIIHDVNVAFELEPPKVEPKPEPPKPEDTMALDKSNGGAKPASAPAARIAAPAIQAPKVRDSQNVSASPVNAKEQVNHAITPETPAEQKPLAVAALPSQAPNSPPSPIRAAENTAQTSGATVAGGNPNGSGTGNGATDGTGGVGTGNAGTGTGSGAAGEGGPGNIQGAVKNGMGNIAPYRKDMLLRISQNWHPQRRSESLILLVKLAHDGSVISSEVVQSAGHKDSDDAALTAIASTAFAPLPDWYQGQTLSFKVSMDKVERLQNN